jgi:Lrp/AsnC family transcriptional regulator, leucine-responsive regulatory protein
MKLGQLDSEFDQIDLRILASLQENCKLPLARIAEKVGLSAPSVIERIKKLEDQHVITAYRAILNARRLGKDVTAFIGVSISHPKLISEFETQIAQLAGVLECHHVTGEHTLLLKVKTENTSSLEELISEIRSIEGVERTETMVVLSTHTERTQIAIDVDAELPAKRPRRDGDKHAVHLKGV